MTCFLEISGNHLDVVDSMLSGNLRPFLRVVDLLQITCSFVVVISTLLGVLFLQRGNSILLCLSLMCVSI